jgi:aminoglycoside phosphotransferase (APT) family kinase protein
MAHLWQQTIKISEKKARELIEGQHQLGIYTIDSLEEGWDNVAYLVNKKFIFRFPRREAGVICMENEIAMLPFIAKHVAFLLSKPQWVGKPSASYPYPFAGYTLISGKSLCDSSFTLIHDEIFAQTLAIWLRELHSIKVANNYTSLIKGDHQWRLNVIGRLSRSEENILRYEQYFIQAGFNKKTLLDVISVLKKFKFTNKQKSYLHGDLYSRHIIVNPVNLLPVGLIDWGDIHVGHPGIDLAIGMIFTEANLQSFLTTYGLIDKETINVMLFHSFNHSISFLPYAYEQDKDSLKRWAQLVLNRVIEEVNKLK